MPTIDPSKVVPTEQLLELLQRSGVTKDTFAYMMGVPAGTLIDLARGGNRVRQVHLNAAKFAMLRMGFSVEMDPVPAWVTQKRGRRHRNNPGASHGHG